MEDERRKDRPLTGDPVTDPTEPATRDPATTYPGVHGVAPGVHGVPPLRPGTPPEEPAERATADADTTDDPRVDRVEPDLDAPRLRRAVLGGLDGHGLIIVVRNAEGGVASIDGTWRAGDSTNTLAELERALPVGSVATFEGMLIESRTPGSSEEVSLEVVIDRHAEYQREEGGVLRIVGFTPRDVT
jgi:hypothetical protein